METSCVRLPSIPTGNSCGACRFSITLWVTTHTQFSPVILKDRAACRMRSASSRVQYNSMTRDSDATSSCRSEFFVTSTELRIVNLCNVNVPTARVTTRNQSTAARWFRRPRDRYAHVSDGTGAIPSRDADVFPFRANITDINPRNTLGKAQIAFFLFFYHRKSLDKKPIGPTVTTDKINSKKN